MRKRVLFVDRDDVILVEPSDYQIDSLEKFKFVPGAIAGLKELTRNKEFYLVMVSNQDGLGTDSFPEDTFWPCQNLMIDILAGEGVVFDEIIVDRTFERDNLPTRKPGTALLTHIIKNESFDIKNSFVIGDRITDIKLAKNIGCHAIKFIPPQGEKFKQDDHSDQIEPSFKSSSWSEIARYILAQERAIKVIRDTNETKINLSLNIDGTGISSISTGIGFFDHMLNNFAKHANFDLDLKVNGDLHVDEHHTVEDTAIALGEAINQALGNKRGIVRYSFLLPMDEALATIALDISGRSYLVFDAEFKRERVGELPTELFEHFFRSLADASKVTLNIQCKGQNEHHMIEAIFKGVGRVFRDATMRNIDGDIPSTKGVL